MQSFREYLIAEFKPNAPTYVAAEFKYAYSNKIKIDKKSNVSLLINVIKVTIKLYDKDMNALVSKSISFENNTLPKSAANKLINIAPAELENRFNLALNDISKLIMNDYIESLTDLETKIDSLQRYANVNPSITPNEFKGERISIADDESVEKRKMHRSKSFDM